VRPPIEARTIDDVRDFTHRDKVVHRCPIVRIVFEIGILNDDHVAGDGGESTLQAGAFSLVGFMIDEPHCNHCAGVFSEFQIAVSVQGDAHTAADSVGKICLEPFAGSIL
jgi:hypothetical protein